MNSANNYAPSFSAETPAPDAADVGVRPKVMRRPARFSSSPASPSMPQIHLPPASPADVESNENLALIMTEPGLARALPATPWQDDARFGIVLLCVVVVVNLALMGWLSLLRTAPQAAQQPSSVAAPLNPPAAPKPLTFYAKPAPRAAAIGAPAPTVFAPLYGADSGPEQ